MQGVGRVTDRRDSTVIWCQALELLSLTVAIDAVSSIVDAVSSIIDAVSSIIDAVSSIIDAVSSIIDAVSSIIDAVSSIIDAVSSIIDAVSSIIDAVSSIIDAVSSIIDAVSSIIDAVVYLSIVHHWGTGALGSESCSVSEGVMGRDYRTHPQDWVRFSCLAQQVRGVGVCRERGKG